MNIPFNQVFLTGNESIYLTEALNSGQLSGDGPFTKKCHSWLEDNLKTNKALLTHSCTAALEMAAILIDTQPGDEIIMPSFTFVSTANAFVLRGGIPVFVDIRADTLNINEALIEKAITPRTKAIVVVHYAGVACEMNTIMSIANKHNLFVIEDAAQAIGAKYRDKCLGSIGHLGTLSFHATKNIQCGEGGALLINDPQFMERAEIIREKGTNRAQFFRGMVDKYRWVDIGSSYLPGELIAACLLAQLEKTDYINQARTTVWSQYHNQLAQVEKMSLAQRTSPPSHCHHNGHLYALILNSLNERNHLIFALKKQGIDTPFHYVALHQTLGGQTYGKASAPLPVTEKVADSLIRLPLWVGLTTEQISLICNHIVNELNTLRAN